MKFDSKKALESFINKCDELMIPSEESTTSSDERIVTFKMFGKEATCKIISNYGESVNNTIVNNILKIVGSNKSLYDYLYKENKDMFEEINDDPYFKGKKINNGMDLINAMTEDLKYTMYISRGCVYFCGEYWVDPEHGFSIYFPRGKFIKAIQKKYIGDNYVPIATTIGQFSDGL